MTLRHRGTRFVSLPLFSFALVRRHSAVQRRTWPSWETKLVRRRPWLSRDAFLDLLGASNLIPGPSSSELAIHVGYTRVETDRPEGLSSIHPIESEQGVSVIGRAPRKMEVAPISGRLASVKFRCLDEAGRYHDLLLRLRLLNLRRPRPNCRLWDPFLRQPTRFDDR